MKTLTSVKITRKGQITIPKKIRRLLDSDVVEFEVIDRTIVLRPVRTVAGALSIYAGRKGSFQETRDLAWTEAVTEDENS